MADQTIAIDPGILPRPVTLDRQLRQGGDEGIIPTNVPIESATVEQREAILRSLHAERGHLTRARRLDRLAPGEAEYLAELEGCIDYWEAAEARETAAADDVWRRLEEIAGSLLSVQAGIEQQRR